MDMKDHAFLKRIAAESFSESHESAPGEIIRPRSNTAAEPDGDDRGFRRKKEDYISEKMRRYQAAPVITAEYRFGDSFCYVETLLPSMKPMLEEKIGIIGLKYVRSYRPATEQEIRLMTGRHAADDADAEESLFSEEHEPEPIALRTLIVKAKTGLSKTVTETMYGNSEGLIFFITADRVNDLMTVYVSEDSAWDKLMYAPLLRMDHFRMADQLQQRSIHTFSMSADDTDQIFPEEYEDAIRFTLFVSRNTLTDADADISPEEWMDRYEAAYTTSVHCAYKA